MAIVPGKTYEPAFLHITRLADIASINGTSSTYYKAATVSVRDALEKLEKLALKNGWPLTIALMPYQPHTSKRSVGSTYGTHQKRQQKEVPLSAPISSAPSASRPSSSSINTSPNANALASPLRGPIPSCFDSLESCETGTRNCTGHGSCVLAQKASSDESGQKKDCYSCQCKPVVKKNDQGQTQTTRYGGSACQKVDVVVPFWLLAGFTVAMVSIVAWGIGLLWSMGEEELPSVIGAGVSGPKAGR